MANQIIPMSKLRKFLKLSLEGKSLRQISELTGMSRNTIFKYNDLLKFRSKLSYHLIRTFNTVKMNLNHFFQLIILFSTRF
jgi:hypothetical protein